MDCSPLGSSVHGDSPSKNTITGYRALSQGIFPTQVDSPPSEPPGNPRNTIMGYHALLQVVFLTQGLNPGLPHYRRTLYQLRQQGSPRILEGIADLFSRGSSWPRNQTGVSCIAGGFFTSWATREAHGILYVLLCINEDLNEIFLVKTVHLACNAYLAN